MLCASSLLLLGAVVVESLNCHYKSRRAPTLNSLRNASWNTGTESCEGSWTACARWLTDLGNEWEDYYGGCYDVYNFEKSATSQLVHKYCADRNNSSCTSTQFFSAGTHQHSPTYLCCCFDDLCNATNIYTSFAEQQALTTSTQQPPRGSTQKVACERNMRKAWTRDELPGALQVNDPVEECEAAWAPCVEFVYNDTGGLWRRWRAGCSYEMRGVSYKDIVKQFCTASDQCRQFDMIEPATRAGDGHFVYTHAYMCCCSGTGCKIPDTVRFSLDVEQTVPPSSTTAGQATEASTRAEKVASTGDGRVAASTSDGGGVASTGEGGVVASTGEGGVVASTGEGGVVATASTGDDEGSLLWLWLLLVVIALLLTIVAVAAAAIVVWHKRKAAEKRKKRRVFQAKTMLPMLPFSAYVPRTPTKDVDMPSAVDEGEPSAVDEGEATTTSKAPSSN